MTTTSKNTAFKGRGAVSSPANRYAPLLVEAGADCGDAAPVTECNPVQARSIIARNRSPDVPFDQSINPYQGCEHGCIYCYARPTHAYLDLSPGLDFETKLTAKINAAELLERELARPGYQCKVITLGANTDPYQPVEKTYRITRRLLEVMRHYRHPVSIITRSHLVTRDIDILAELADQGLCSVAMSVTCLDDDLKRTMEPRAPSGSTRLAAMRELGEAGVPTRLLFAPVIPGLNDREMETILAAAADAGARSAAFILLRLPLELSDMFQAWLAQHYPQRAAHVMSLLRQCRGGTDNDSRFGRRMRGVGPVADLLARRFEVGRRRVGLAPGEHGALRTDLFRPPIARGAETAGQIDLFDT